MVSHLKAMLVVLLFLIACTARGAASSIDGAQQAEFVEHLSDLIDRVYLDPDKGSRLAAGLRERIAQGEFDGSAEPHAFAEELTKSLREASGDLHFKVRYAGASTSVSPVAEFLEGRRSAGESLRQEFNGFKEVANRGRGVGYLAFSVFRDRGLDDLESALALLRHADAVVLDLRGHRGGTVEVTRRLLSQFLPPNTHYADTYARNGFVSHDLTLGGHRSFNERAVPLFILVDGETASGAEAIAFHLQHLKRATVTGARTMGAAHSGGTWMIDGFSVFVPNERHVNPEDGMSWERVGVTPDVVMPAEAMLAETINLASTAAARFAKLREQRHKELVQALMQRAEAMRADMMPADWQSTRGAMATLVDEGLLDEAACNELGYLYLGREQFGPALAVLSGNTDLHPRSANAQDSLAEAFESAGRLDDALRHYQRAVDLAQANRSESVEQHRTGLRRVQDKLRAMPQGRE